MPAENTIKWPKTVLLQRLGDILRSVRVSQNVSDEQIATRFSAAAKQHRNLPDSEQSQIFEIFRSGGIDALEESKGGTVQLSLHDFKLLADIYGVHRILLDPALSTPVEVCCVASLNDSMEVDDDVHYGFRTLYKTPEKCLRDAETVSIVKVEVQSGAYSDTHWHAGDELILVLRGSIDVLLLGSGLRARLNASDYIHFYSEHEHCVMNTASDTAEFLVVRFARSSRRQKLIDHLKLASQELSTTIKRELLANVDPRSEQFIPGNPWPKEVADRPALGNLLQLLCTAKFRSDNRRLTLSELAVAGKRQGFSRARLNRIHHGHSPVQTGELVALAELYDVAPMLLFDYCFPAHRHAIAVRCNPGETAIPPLRDREMLIIPATATEDRQSYLIPNKRLADSNASIAYLHLDIGAESPKNRHPGHEILIPIKGKVSLHFDGPSVNLNSESQQFAHFHSSRCHWVRNNGESSAELFVIRIYE